MYSPWSQWSNESSSLLLPKTSCIIQIINSATHHTSHAYLQNNRVRGIQINRKPPLICRSMPRSQIRLQITSIRRRHTPRRAPARTLALFGAGAHIHAGLHADCVERCQVICLVAAEVEAAVEAELCAAGGVGCVQGEAVRLWEVSWWCSFPDA